MPWQIGPWATWSPSTCTPWVRHCEATCRTCPPPWCQCPCTETSFASCRVRASLAAFGNGWLGRTLTFWGIEISPVPMGSGTQSLLPTVLPRWDAAGAWRAVTAVPALPSCLVLSPEIPQPENCRKQLLLALESPAVPLQNTLTLQFLLRHLGKVSQQAESNSLHPRALGEIFGPLLLRLPGARYVRLLGSSRAPSVSHCACQDEESSL